MKWILPFIATVTAIISYILPHTANAQSVSLYQQPKIGVALGHRIIKWQENLGKNHFAESLPQIDLFIEFPLFERFSVKFGHERTSKRTNLVRYNGDDVVLSTPGGPVGINTNYITNTKLTANYIDGIYNHPFITRDNYSIQLLVFLGLSKGKLRLIQKDISDAEVFIEENLTTAKKIFFRKGIGIQSVLTNGCSITMGITHEKISKLKSVLETNVDTYTAKANSSIIFNIGVSYQL